MLKRILMGFWKDESGMGTIEVVVIIAVLVAVALVFRQGIGDFVNKLMRQFFTVPDKPVIEYTS